MASARLRIGHGSSVIRTLTAEYGSYALTGQAANFNRSQITGLPFNDGFESGNFALWDAVGGVVTNTTSDSFEGTRSASTVVATGQQSDNYLEYHFGDHQGVNGSPTGMNDLWVRFSHKWASTWTEGAGVVAQKLWLLNAHNPVSNRRRYQVTFNIFGPSSGSNGQYFFDIYRWNEDTSFGGTIHNIPIPFNRVLGRWEEFVFRIRMNTPGVSDGQLECWTKAEGETSYTQRLTRSDLNMRDATDYTPNRLIGLSNYDTITTRNGTRFWDSMYLGQDPVDLSDDVDPPADNDGLIVTNYANYDPDDATVQSIVINDTVDKSGHGTNGSIVSIANEVWWNGASVPVATMYPPSSVGDWYSGLGNIEVWKGATKTVRQINVRWESRYSDLHTLDSAQLPKLLILDTYRELRVGEDVLKDRPIIFLAHANEADSPANRVANTLVYAPSMDTVRMFSSTNITPAVEFDDGGWTGYQNQLQPMYVRATAGTDSAGNPIVDADEYLCHELRVNVMGTADEPSGVIAIRVTRRNGSFIERACAFTFTPNDQGERPLINTNFIHRVDTMGGGYYNNAQAHNDALWTKMGRVITVATNYQPTVGRAWLGPPTGFVEV